MSAGLIRKGRKWVFATTKMRQEGCGIERQVVGRIGSQEHDRSVMGWLSSAIELEGRDRTTVVGANNFRLFSLIPPNA